MDKPIPRVSPDDVGTFWLGPDDQVWLLDSFCEHPTVSWRRLDDESIRRGGAVGSPITGGFRRLVVETAA